VTKPANDKDKQHLVTAASDDYGDGRHQRCVTVATKESDGQQMWQVTGVA